MLPVFDAHVDSIQRALDLGHDLARSTPGHLDLPRAERGGLRAVVTTAWVDPKYEAGGRSADRARALIGALHDLARRHPEQLRLCGNGAELAAQGGPIAAIPAIEGGHPLEGSHERLVEFFEYGVRVLTLVWNNHLDWVRSCQPAEGADVPEG
ncbi:MAG: membrane dipeptidase [Planctomycetota bacterium]